MARVTVEDCIVKIPNRFDLVMTAAQRARDISAGMALTVERDNDRNPVVALREIAESTVDTDALEENLIKGLQRHIEYDEPEEDEMDLLAFQQDLESESSEPPRQQVQEETAEEAPAAEGEDDDAMEAVLREFSGDGGEDADNADS